MFMISQIEFFWEFFYKWKFIWNEGTVKFIEVAVLFSITTEVHIITNTSFDTSEHNPDFYQPHNLLNLQKNPESKSISLPGFFVWSLDFFEVFWSTWHIGKSTFNFALQPMFKFPAYRFAFLLIPVSLFCTIISMSSLLISPSTRMLSAYIQMHSILLLYLSVIIAFMVG